MAFKTIIFLAVVVLLFQFVRSQIGYATLNGGTRGGTGGPTVSVSTEAALINALADNNPRVIRITFNIRATGRIRVGSNKSILGATPDAGITNGGFFLSGVENVIFRGLRFSSTINPFNSIEIRRSTHVWVDHNEFLSNKSESVLKVDHSSDWITVSWNLFDNLRKTSFIGDSDDNGGPGRWLHVTFYNNRFRNVDNAITSVRLGTAHIFNNLFENMDSSKINSRKGAQVFVEKNAFINTKINARRSLTTSLINREIGFEIERNYEYGDASKRQALITREQTFTNPPYKYRVDSLSSIESLVRKNAGATIRF